MVIDDVDDNLGTDTNNLMKIETNTLEIEDNTLEIEDDTFEKIGHEDGRWLDAAEKAADSNNHSRQGSIFDDLHHGWNIHLIAENELLGAAESIEIPAKKLTTLKPRKEVTGHKVTSDELKFDDMILDAAKSIANATAALIKAATEAQKELVFQGKVQKRTHLVSEDGQWSEGLVSAARTVAPATHNLCEAANRAIPVKKKYS